MLFEKCTGMPKYNQINIQTGCPKSPLPIRLNLSQFIFTDMNTRVQSVQQYDEADVSLKCFSRINNKNNVFHSRTYALHYDG